MKAKLPVRIKGTLDFEESILNMGRMSVYYGD